MGLAAFVALCVLLRSGTGEGSEAGLVSGGSEWDLGAEGTYQEAEEAIIVSRATAARVEDEGLSWRA